MQPYEIFIARLFVIGGIGGIVYSLFTMYLSIRAKRWKKTPAQILSSHVDISYDDEGDCEYEAKIHYSYSYRGHQYFSKRIAYGYVGNTIEYFAKRVAYKFFPDTPAFAYINTKHPKTSVLLVGIKPFHFFNLIFFLLFTVIAIHFSELI